MHDRQVDCLEGNTFLISDAAGDVEPNSDHVLGLFYRDMRHLSRWQLTIDGIPLDMLSSGMSGYPAARWRHQA